MEDEQLLATINSLREALRICPDNVPLRGLYAENLLKAGKIEEARDELEILIKSDPQDTHFRILLAQICLERLETSKGIVLIEDMVRAGNAPDEVFVRRYEKGAIILTTNRPMEDWGQVLGDTAAAGAILDRLLHHAEVIRLQGRSYRMHNRRELQSQKAEEALTGKTE